MKFEVFEAKTLEDAKAKALEELNVSEEEIISTYEEKKGKLFKGSTVLFKAVKISTVAEFIKDNLKELLENMNIEAQFETNVRNSQINIKMYSDKNNILIGKNGQTLRFNSYECSEVIPDLGCIELSLSCIDGVPIYSSGGGYWT